MMKLFQKLINLLKVLLLMQTKYHLNGKEINLTSDNIAISSTNFSVDKNGNITATSGKIGGFTLGATVFSTTTNGIYDFNAYDAFIAMATWVYEVSLPSSLFNLYDIEKDGEVDTFDADKMFRINAGQISNTYKTTGTLKIDTSNPKNFISVKHENDLAVSIGVGGINTYMLGAENIVVGKTGSDQLIKKQVLISGSDASIYCDGSVTAKNISNSSLESIKKNIVKFDDALEIIKNSNIYEYNFKDEKDTDKKHIGFVIGDVTKNKYETPNEVLSSNKKGIENYSMSSIEWRALQQILERLEIVEKKVS